MYLTFRATEKRGKGSEKGTEVFHSTYTKFFDHFTNSIDRFFIEAHA